MKARKSLEQQKLLKKLRSIQSKDELFQIFKGVKTQNDILSEDTSMLKDKIKLMKNKYRAQLQEDYLKKKLTPQQEQLQAHKQELADKNKIMQQLKKRKENNIYRQSYEELSSQMKHIYDQIKKTQQEKETQSKVMNNLIREKDKLQMSLSIQIQQSQLNGPQIIQLQKENAKLRKQILAEKQKGYAKQYQSAKVVSSIYSIKKKLAKSSSTVLPKIRSQSIATPKNPQQQEHLKKQVVKLKEQVQNIQFSQMKNQNEQKQKYQIYINQNKSLLQKFRLLQHHKTKVQTELNKYKAKFQHLQKQTQQRLKQMKQTKDCATQIKQYVLPNTIPLRRDFAGVIGNKLRFDDRFFLEKNTKARIKGFIIFQNDAASNGKGSIVGIRAVYNDLEANSRNHVPLPGNYLSKCKQSKIEVAEDDFIKLFKIKYNTIDTRITKIQVRSNKNNKYEIGQKKMFNQVSANQTVYGFDIGVRECPVSLFGSYIFFRSHWYLQSLGVQINELN